MSDLDERVADGLRRGLSYKVIAYENQVRLSTVSQVKARLAKRLGCASRVALIARLRGATSWPEVSPAVLTRSVRQVVELALRGHSNADIARLRSVSPRTVANQLAAAYRTLRVRSRAELAALVFVSATAA